MGCGTPQATRLLAGGDAGAGRAPSASAAAVAPGGGRARCPSALAAFLFGSTLLSTAMPAAAATLLPQEVAWGGLALAVATVLAAGLAILRRRSGGDRRAAERDLALADARLAAERAEALIEADDQRLLVLDDPAPPRLAGRLPAELGAPVAAERFLAFEEWLTADAAAALRARLAALTARGEGFRLALATAAGGRLDAAGGTAGGRAVVRFRDISGDRKRLVELEASVDRLRRETGALKSLIETLPHPVWLRDAGQRLIWVNTAYANAVEADDPAAAVAGNVDLVDSDGRRTLDQRHARSSIARERLAVVAAGERRMLDVVEVASDHGTGGIGVDVTELEKIHGALKRTIESHSRTLDQLATAVAIFGPDRRLAFYNAAYQTLWGLDAGLLEGRPEDGALLDALRAARRLPEQADFRAWKQELLTAYQSLETREHWWHLPDGQTLRVLVNPHPQGGVTYVYENVTERLDLESRYNALSRVQGETLDHLTEGVAVFGSDGRLRLWNPAFEAVWRIDDAVLTSRPHVADLVVVLAPQDAEVPAWRKIAGAVTGLVDGRTRVAGRLERPDRTVIDYATVPLPDGATLVTFVNVTDSVKVERALVDRNEALVEADRLKDAFIQHVSYELRSPLTTIIGFAEFLSQPVIGTLNDRQREYTGYILSSSKALLAIINDILDLATIDAGVMDLELAEIDVAGTIAAAAEGLQDRLREARLTLETRVPDDVGSFVADEKRVRQVLFNLISNAIAYSEAGGRVEVSCARDGEAIRIAVSDRGPGIPSALIDQVFDRFIADPAAGGERRGAGLGLSIVKSFVELHGGTVAIDSKEGVGTTVVCRFPRRPAERPGRAPARRRAGQ